MKRDLRETQAYKDVEAYFAKIHGPGFGRLTEASDVVPSPDGRRIAFAGSRRASLEAPVESRICIVDVDTGRLEEITSGPNSDHAPEWSPDGGSLSFLSDRDCKGRSDLYVLSGERLGEARRVPGIEGAVESHSWSPGGTRILIGVAGLEAGAAGAAGSGAAATAGEVPDWMPEVASDASDEWRRLLVHDLGSASTAPLALGDINVWEAAWCGEEAVVAVVSDDPLEDSWYHSRLERITLGGIRRVLFEPEWQIGLPSATPSGERIAVVEAACSDRLVVAGDLVVIGPDGEPRRIDTSSVDVSDIHWVTEELLFYIGLRGLDTVAGTYDAGTDEVREFYEGAATACRFHPRARPLAEGRFTAPMESHDAYPEVSIVDGDGIEPITSLEHPGAKEAAAMLGRVQRVQWQAEDGLPMEGLLATPDGAGPFAVVMDVHGGPVGSYKHNWLLRSERIPFFVSRGYAVFQPNPRGSSGRGQEFAREVYGDMGGRDTGDLLSGLDALIERGVVDEERMCVTGGSYGGYMTEWLVTQTDRFAAAVSISPVTNWYSQHFGSNIGEFDRLYLQAEPTAPDGPHFHRSPVFFADNVTTPTLITAGLQDRCTPPGQAVEFYQALRRRGVPSSLALYPKEGHGVRNFPAFIDFLARTIIWFERFARPR